MTMTVDVALLIYAAILLVNAGNIGFMLWWAIVYPKASMIFYCIATLFISIEYSFAISFVSRYRGGEWYKTIRHEWWWELKNLPVLAVFTVILSIFIYRIVTTVESPK